MQNAKSAANPINRLTDGAARGIMVLPEIIISDFRDKIKRNL